MTHGDVATDAGPPGRRADVDRVWHAEGDGFRSGGLAAPQVWSWHVPEGIGDVIASITAGRESFDGEIAELVVPDGHVRLVFDVGDRVDATIEGPTTQPTVLRLSGTIEQLGIAVAPGAVRTLLGVPASELRHQRPRLDEVWRRDASAWLEAIVNATPELRPSLARTLVIDQLARSCRRPDPLVANAVRIIDAGPPTRRVRDLAERLGIGERQLQQRFRDTSGLSAKEHLRLARLRAFWHAREHGVPRLSAAAREAGFADQAHAAREIKTLTGHTISQLADLGFVQDAR